MHNAAEGHLIGGSPSDHRQHPMHYSPYPTSAGYNQSPSSAIAASMSPSLLAPPGLDNPFAYTHDMSAPTSPLSVDFDPHSGRNSPFDIVNMPGTPTHLQNGSNALFGSGDLTAADGIQGMTLTGGNSSPHSATVGPASSMEQILSSNMGHRLSPVAAFTSYRQSQQDMPSPISPTTPQFLSPTESSAQTSPTSYAPMQQAFDPNLNSPVGSYAVPSTGQLDIRLAAANFSGANQQYPDVFDDMDPNDGGGMFFGSGDRSRRGSHQSIASSHSGHGTFLQLNAASPFAPGSAPISAAASPNMGMLSDLGDLSNEMALLGQSDGTSNPTCASSTKGCTCLNLDGTLKPPGEMCALDNCSCCGRRNYTDSMNALSMNALFGPTASSGFAVSTERDTASMGTVAASANGNSPPVASSLGMGYTQALQIPIQANRSRSSSQSSQISNASFSSLTNGMGGMDLSMGGGGGATALGRANSTGQIGRGGSKFKHIAPKPIHHNTDPVPSRTGGVGLTGAQQPFSFPRTSGGGPTQPPPAVILTQPQPTDGTSLEQLFQGTLDSSPNPSLFGGNSPNASYGNNQPFNPKPMFDFTSTATATSDIRHSRNFSHPANLQTVGTSLSGPPSPHTRSPIHFGDSSGTGSGPASPLLHHPSSPGPNSPIITQPSSPSMHQSTPIITFSHGRSQSSSNAGLLEPRPLHYSHASGHGRSASASLLDPLGRSSSFPSVIVTPASPHPGSSGQRH
ncbi:hypothetical protein M407DRAFT_25130 [Tulasnella calospora MUT 4182]|uniref:Uncharacterized protein n=1 Tax=Tulasnella calospora MUT 4182 TaxID=1051891 RepID=A0A0C3KVL8_9AGAM|nr:hypothetical protein M407DRAFT_25130 [Tulasnella calospora MUT 4182]